MERKSCWRPAYGEGWVWRLEADIGNDLYSEYKVKNQDKDKLSLFIFIGKTRGASLDGEEDRTVYLGSTKSVFEFV